MFSDISSMLWRINVFIKRGSGSDRETDIKNMINKIETLLMDDGIGISKMDFSRMVSICDLAILLFVIPLIILFGYLAMCYYIEL